MGVSKNRGKTPKMDGENNSKPYEQMDDLGGFTTPIFGSTPIWIHMILWFPIISFMSVSRSSICVQVSSNLSGEIPNVSFIVETVQRWWFRNPANHEVDSLSVYPIIYRVLAPSKKVG